MKTQPEVKKVVHVSREFRGLAGAGGVQDVTAGLCKATAAMGIETHLFLPYYRVIPREKDLELILGESFNVAMNYPNLERFEQVKIRKYKLMDNLIVNLIDSPRYQYLLESDNIIERHGIYQYTAEEAMAIARPELEGQGYFDFFAMNVLLAKATLHALDQMHLRPDIIHCHDGQAALLPLLARASEDGFAPYLGYVPSLLTIHNAGRGYHQEIYDLDFAAAICGIPRDVIKGCLLEGGFDPLLAGCLFGNAVNTVSENYAKELQHSGDDWRTGWLGHALAGYGIELRGITNGISLEAGNLQDMDGFKDKRTIKKMTLEAIGKGQVPEKITLYGTIHKREDVPLLTFIGRLDHQKGYDILADAIDLLFSKDIEVQLLGLGDQNLVVEARFRQLATKYKGRLCFAKGFSSDFAQKIYEAGDFFVIPSRFEPCGLTDYIAQLSGNVPIVNRVGGLVKTLDGRFGLSYLGGPRELLQALERALEIYRQPGQEILHKIQEEAVKNIRENFTWDKIVAKKYLPLYREAITKAEPVLPY